MRRGLTNIFPKWKNIFSFWNDFFFKFFSQLEKMFRKAIADWISCYFFYLQYAGTVIAVKRVLSKHNTNWQPTHFSPMNTPIRKLSRDDYCSGSLNYCDSLISLMFEKFKLLCQNDFLRREIVNAVNQIVHHTHCLLCHQFT